MVTVMLITIGKTVSLCSLQQYLLRLLQGPVAMFVNLFRVENDARAVEVDSLPPQLQCDT